MAVGVAAVGAVVLDSVAATDLGPSNQNLCSSYLSFYEYQTFTFKD